MRTKHIKTKSLELNDDTEAVGKAIIWIARGTIAYSVIMLCGIFLGSPL